MRIKKDKFRNVYEVWDGKTPLYTIGGVERFIELANAIVKISVGSDFIISSPNREAKAKGFGKYHYIKGFLLAFWQDVKKKLKNGKNESK